MQQFLMSLLSRLLVFVVTHDFTFVVDLSASYIFAGLLS